MDWRGLVGIRATKLLTAWPVHGNWDTPKFISFHKLSKRSGVIRVSKPEWGEKRECPECGARFYDLKRDPIICPKCGTPYLVTTEKAPVAVPKNSAGEGEQLASVESAEGIVPGTAGDEGLEEIDIDDDADDEDDDLIEDAAELVKEDDMSDVLDGAVDGSKTDE